jgi:hypothetical protein
VSALVDVAEMIADEREMDSKATVAEAPALAAGVAEIVSVLAVETGNHLVDCALAKRLGSATGPRESLVLVAGYSPEGIEEKTQRMFVVVMLVVAVHAAAAAAFGDSVRLPPTPLVLWKRLTSTWLANPDWDSCLVVTHLAAVVEGRDQRRTHCLSCYSEGAAFVGLCKVIPGCLVAQGGIGSVVWL